MDGWCIMTALAYLAASVFFVALAVLFFGAVYVMATAGHRGVPDMPPRGIPEPPPRPRLREGSMRCGGLRPPSNEPRPDWVVEPTKRRR